MMESCYFLPPCTQCTGMRGWRAQLIVSDVGLLQMEAFFPTCERNNTTFTFATTVQDLCPAPVLLTH